MTHSGVHKCVIVLFCLFVLGEIEGAIGPIFIVSSSSTTLEPYFVFIQDLNKNGNNIHTNFLHILKLDHLVHPTGCFSATILLFFKIACSITY